MAAFEKSNQSLDQSINKMTNCSSAIGDGIGSGIKMMAQAFTQQPPDYVPAPYPPQYMYGSPGMMSSTVRMPSTHQFHTNQPLNPASPYGTSSTPGDALSSAAHTL